jgi:hypothetical protein
MTRPLRRTIGAAVRGASGNASAWLDRGRRPTHHPVVGVVGFYGWGNYGDELFWHVFREHLGDAMELRNIIGPEARARGIPLRRVVRDLDAVLLGGGDLVIPWRPSRYWNEALLHRPVFIAGVGVPLWQEPTELGVGRLRRFFRHPAVRLVAARDRRSGDWIAEQLAPPAGVRVVPDLACALTLPEATPPPGPPIFGVNVRNRADGIDDLGLVRELCDRAASRGYRIRRIVLGTGDVGSADMEATTRLGLDGTELVAGDDLEAISRAIGECRVFATMKFHGVVAATLYGRVPISLRRSTKTQNFLTTIARPELLSSIDDPALPAFAERDLAPVDPEVGVRLRHEARQFLDELRTEILAQAAAGWQPIPS